MEKLFQAEQKIPRHVIDNYKKENLEKEFILAFFETLPIENLKQLIKFQEIDPWNKSIWDNVDQIPDFIGLLCSLREKKQVMYKCELLLEV